MFIFPHGDWKHSIRSVILDWRQRSAGRSSEGERSVGHSSRPVSFPVNVLQPTHNFTKRVPATVFLLHTNICFYISTSPSLFVQRYDIQYREHVKHVGLKLKTCPTSVSNLPKLRVINQILLDNENGGWSCREWKPCETGVIYIYIYIYGVVVRVFVNSPGDRSSIQGRIISKTQKMVSDASFLNTQH